MSPRVLHVHSEKGFTLTELIVVVAIISVMAGIAMPSLLQFRRNLACRQAAMSIVSSLRQSRSQAISTNLEQQVRFGTSNRWNLQIGDRPYSAATWSIGGWINAPAAVGVIPAQYIQFVPNGTSISTNSTISIQDATGVTRFTVDVEPTGRIRVAGPL